MLHRCIRYPCVYTSCMSPALSGCLALQHAKLGDALKILTFDFYSGLPHIHYLGVGCVSTDPTRLVQATPITEIH